MRRSRRAYLLAVALMVGVLLGFAGGTSSALTATDLLKQKPFPPTDVSLFGPGVYSDAPPMVPAGVARNDETFLRNKLKALVEQRFGVGSTEAEEALALFDAESTKQIVPHPRLRAALVSLKGTIGEPALNAALSGLYKVYFGAPPSPASIAQVIDPPGPGMEIVVNQVYQYEDFRLLASGIHHESLHRDGLASKKEIMICQSIDHLVYGEFLLESPNLATSGTQLARRLNTELMARLNSRDAQGNLRLLTSTSNVYPGGTPRAYYAARYEPLGESTPGNGYLRQEVRNVVGPGVTLPSTVDFDDSTVNLLDLNQNALTPEEVVRLSRILKLNVFKPTITAVTPTGSITDRTPTIGATVSDRETDLSASNIQLFVDGVQKSSFSYDSATDRLTYSGQSFAVGRHTVRVVATDAQGKVGQKSWSFTES